MIEKCCQLIIEFWDILGLKALEEIYNFLKLNEN